MGILVLIHYYNWYYPNIIQTWDIIQYSYNQQLMD